MTIKFYPLSVDSVFKRDITKPGGKGKVNGIGFLPTEFSVVETVHFEPVVNVFKPKLYTHFAKVWINGKG
jgi:hypothetical protein